MALSNYQNLRVWRSGMDLVRCVYRLTRRFPRHETFGLSSQVRRAAVSIPANIAEGHTRGTTKEFLRYITIAHGSLAELETMFVVAEDLQYVDAESLAEFGALCGATSRMLSALRRTLMNKLRKSPNP